MNDESLPGLGTRDVPFLDLLGARPVKREDGTYELHLKIERKHLRPHGIVHGGVTASLLDTALGLTAGAAADTDHHMVTVQLNINYIRPTWEGEDVIARGELQHRGSKTAVVRGELRNADNQLIATATGTFMYLPLPKGTKVEKPN
ncbi:Acyl-coenzyme A thioesterase PaaI [Polystyrenella longa]|uniref:Medium/long-chain acyl-CoA thioesterase YigI n=1 Tax=Polystyrenella longa TaxID=2528007 RepID=A0A518CN50_9PLAN|nr:PaaI family thioesterase [Polystyrenella longa]QDU80649.1 Acyl-coenzyme A thioesterase PaaI [Polystyrenella longa]